MSKDIKEVGLVKFPVQDECLISFGYTELSTRELTRMRRTEWARISDLPSYKVGNHNDPDRALIRALTRELSSRHAIGRESPYPDSSDIDQTYLYPGEPAPPGFKWMLVADTDPGIVAYRVHGPSDVEFVYE